jgi:hypothetical protein
LPAFYIQPDLDQAAGIADQLADPVSGAALASDYGLEVQPFYVDAEMLRFGVDHAADIALSAIR